MPGRAFAAIEILLMGEFEGVISEKGDRVIIKVYVTPDAKKREIGYNEWRGAFEVKIDARAEQGKANEAIIHFLADTFGIERSGIRIVRGARGRRKTIELKGIRKEDVIRSLIK